VSVVIMGAGANVALPQRQSGLRALEGLALAFLVAAQRSVGSQKCGVSQQFLTTIRHFVGVIRNG
jgi:hypothetical protein